jgi:hypothetical protein
MHDAVWHEATAWAHVVHTPLTDDWQAFWQLTSPTAHAQKQSK